MGLRLSLLIGMGVASAFTGAAQAADTAKGKTLARSLCSNCHIVGPGESGKVVNADVPSFMAVAAKEGQSADNIKKVIASPRHPDMPKVQLTKREVDDIAAYIVSLKRP